MKTTVIIQFEIEGFHKWSAAPKEVKFLSYRHRHVFRIKAGFQVNHADREKEIFIQRDILRSYLENKYGNPCEFNDMSCEMIGLDLMNKFLLDEIKFVEVWEEETGGAKIEL
tara:strand:+ start:713 stop:1048 length:336 start_codon:yes stop_codon:yes gene_type:complete